MPHTTANRRKPPQTAANRCTRENTTTAKRRKPPQTAANRHTPPQTAASCRKLPQAATNYRKLCSKVCSKLPRESNNAANRREQQGTL
eukprot:893360-Alexandrium_andersonii.AAC.1